MGVEITKIYRSLSKTQYLIIVFIILNFTGCSNEKKIEFNELFSQVIGFDDNDEQYKAIKDDIVLMLDNKQIDEFNEDYFFSREIKFISPGDGMAELFISFGSDDNAIYSYGITSIEKIKNELIINVKQTGAIEVKRVEGFNGVFKWIIIAELDAKYLTDDMELKINHE